MKTFNKELKHWCIDHMIEHRDQDKLMPGNWWNGGAGCFYGCMTHSEENVLEKASKLMQLPMWLIILTEKIFEKLPKKTQLDFPVKLLKSIPTNRNIEKVKHKIAILRLTPLAKNNPSVRAEIQGVIDCHQDFLNDKKDINWDKVRSAASSSADSADSAARSAAWSAVWSSINSTASSAADSATSSADRSATWQIEADNLIKTLSEMEDK